MSTDTSYSDTFAADKRIDAFRARMIIKENPAYTQASQQASTRTSTLYQQATSALSSAVTSYQKASKLHPRNTTYLQELANAAANSGNSKVAVAALKKYLKVDPHSPLAPQIKKEIRRSRRPRRRSTPATASRR